MASINLPCHALPMDEPAPSNVIKGPDGSISYGWVLTETERAHLSSMLDVDVSGLEIRGNVMRQERAVCRGCGKHSGLDDLVHNALYAGIHDATFMLDVLVNGPQGPSPVHELACSRCTTQYEGTFAWGPDNWRF